MKSYKQYMMESDEQKLIKKMDKIRKTIRNHAGRKGSTVHSRKSENLIYRYEETSEELKDAGIWDDWCKKIGRSPGHDAYDIFA